MSEPSERQSEEGENYYNYYPAEEDAGSYEYFYPRWKNAPRTPSDFVPSKTPISSCRDSDYERWLDDYYQDLVKSALPTFAEKECDTSDLIFEKKSKEFAEPLFRSHRKGPWSFSPKYWGPKEVRRHWPLGKSTREYLFFPSIHPDLNLRSRYGRFQSLLYTAAAVPEVSHQNVVGNVSKRILMSFLIQKPKMVKVINCENLYKLKWFDFMTRKTVLRCLCKFLKVQHQLEKVHFENASLKRLEAIIILCALCRGGGATIKELHIWKMFDYGQSPLLLNDLPEKKNRMNGNRSMELFMQIHYLQILYQFSSLTHLSVNYSYLANPEGDAILCLKSLRTGCLKELRILCLKEERPLLTNPGYGVGGYLISDGAWRRASEWCPELRVKFVFLNVPQYENIIVFLSKSIPVSSVYISCGPNFEFETPWEIDCTLLELRNWYSDTLVSLSLHLWHHRDLLDFVIKDKILDEFPNLVNFEFIGVLEDVETLNQFCCRLVNGNYNLKTFLFWVEEQHTNRKRLNKMRERVMEIRTNYNRKFQVVDIDADIQLYTL